MPALPGVRRAEELKGEETMKATGILAGMRAAIEEGLERPAPRTLGGCPAHGTADISTFGVDTVREQCCAITGYSPIDNHPIRRCHWHAEWVWDGSGYRPSGELKGEEDQPCDACGELSICQQATDPDGNVWTLCADCNPEMEGI